MTTLHQWIAVAISLFMIVIFFGVGNFASFFTFWEKAPEASRNSAAAAAGDVRGASSVTIEGMNIEDIAVGEGDEVKVGDSVSVQYTGTLTDGTKFDSSYDHGDAFSFAVGAGQVIKGWDLGLVGMKVGGKRKLTIPSNLAYGDQGIGPIPPGATLVFEIELVKIGN